ncbi:unnamed protein product [Sympodiomycopsis kandeliae]
MVRCLDLLATLAATLTLVQGQFVTKTSPLNSIDILLDSPIGAQTCRQSQITWSWDRVGALPGDYIALSLINATDFASVLSGGSSSSRKRSAIGTHRDIRDHRLQVQAQKRAQIKGVPIEGAEAIPFSETSFLWPQVKAYAGQYRLLLTIISSGQAVVSDPFTITGTDISCLSASAASATLQSGGAASTYGTSSSASQSQTPASSSSAVQGSSIPTLGSLPATTPDSASGGSNDASDSSSGSKSNSGAIAAGVIVPLIALAVAIIGWFWYRKRQNQSASHSEEPSSAWKEKFTGAGGAAAGGSRTIGSPRGLGGKEVQHTRGISGPQAATSAGLAAVAGMVPMQLRKEKDHAALQGTLDYSNGGHQELRRGSPDQPGSPTNGQWVNFADEDVHNIVGARPLSRDTIDSAHIGDYRSMGTPSSTDEIAPRGDASRLYAQGRNIPLGSRSPNSMQHDSMSTFGTPADRASSSMRSGLGRDLIAGTPQPTPASPGQVSISLPRSVELASPFADSAAGSGHVATDDNHHDATDAEELQGADLERSDSTGSAFGIKRKPVPRLTVAGPPESKGSEVNHSSKTSSNNHGGLHSMPDEVDGAANSVSPNPFSDQHNVEANDPGEMRSQWFSSHDAAYETDAFEPVEEVGAQADDSPVIPGTPPRRQPSVPSTPASAIHPMDQSFSPEHDQSAKDQYHLSINLAQDNGFRVSFGQS